jgi:hypothetical protein
VRCDPGTKDQYYQCLTYSNTFLLSTHNRINNKGSLYVTQTEDLSQWFPVLMVPCSLHEMTTPLHVMAHDSVVHAFSRKGFIDGKR